MVRGIDTRRIVDGVSIDPSAVTGKGDTASLGETEIGPLAHNLTSEVRGIDPDRVIGLVPGIRMAFGWRFHIGADTAEIQQLHPSLQDGADEVQRGEFIFCQVQQGLRFGTDREGLGVARKTA